MKNLNNYLVTFKHGLHGPTKFWAENENDARVQAMVWHRKNTGFVESIDTWPDTFVIDKIQKVG